MAAPGMHRATRRGSAMKSHTAADGALTTNVFSIERAMRDFAMVPHCTRPVTGIGYCRLEDWMPAPGTPRAASTVSPRRLYGHDQTFGQWQESSRRCRG